MRDTEGMASDVGVIPSRRSQALRVEQARFGGWVQAGSACGFCSREVSAERRFDWWAK